MLDLADRVGGAFRGGPVGRVRVGQELEVAPRGLGAPARELRIDFVVAEPGRAQQLARDSHRRLPGVVDAADRVTGQLESPDRLDPVRRRLAHQRVARHEQRLVDVEEDEQHMATLRATYGGDQVSTWSILRLSCKPRSPVGLVKQPGKNASAKNENALALAA